MSVRQSCEPFWIPFKVRQTRLKVKQDLHKHLPVTSSPCRHHWQAKGHAYLKPGFQTTGLLTNTFMKWQVAHDAHHEHPKKAATIPYVLPEDTGSQEKRIGSMGHLPVNGAYESTGFLFGFGPRPSSWGNMRARKHQEYPCGKQNPPKWFSFPRNPKMGPFKTSIFSNSCVHQTLCKIDSKGAFPREGFPIEKGHVPFQKAGGGVHGRVWEDSAVPFIIR